MVHCNFLWNESDLTEVLWRDHEIRGLQESPCNDELSAVVCHQWSDHIGSDAEYRAQVLQQHRLNASVPIINFGDDAGLRLGTAR